MCYFYFNGFRVISTLLKDLRPFMASLYKLCENVAELDILIALAQISTVGSYIRPEFSDYLEIKNSIHPLLDYNSQAMPVPNDIFANAEYNFTIITGPNMGGKSIYIKQIAIMQVMAQLGCYIPATKAVLRLCDRIYSRIGFNDSVELNASTYVIEMKEVQHILKGLTPSSLVIIDELCRGTCSEEGASIAWAICEELLASDAYTFFTTHFLYLTRLEDLYYNVVNRHTAVIQETVGSQNQQRLMYQHKIEAGVTKIDQYGLALAEKTSLPEDTVNLAKELAEIIASRRKLQSHSIHGKSTDRLLYEVNAKVSQALRQKESPATIKNIIQKFKSDYPEIIENLREQNTTSIYDNNSSRAQTTTSNDNKNIFSDTNIFNETKDEFSFVHNSDDVQEKSVEVNSNFGKYSAVKSSTELLNTFLNHADIESNNTKCTNGYNKNNEEDNNQISNEINNNTRQCDNNYSNSCPKTLDNYSAIEESFVNTRLTTPQNTQITSVDSDSDTAIALTQVIAESSDSQSSNILSSDEELMKEAIQEINQDFLNYILTPPEGFRDD